MRKFFVLSLGLVFIAAACNQQPANNNTTSQEKQLTSPSNDNRTFVVQLKAQNNSKQNGVARLKMEGDKVKVEINVSSSTKDVQQPAHIHLGSCTSLGDVKYALNNVVNGKSVTLIDTTLDEIIASLPLAVNIHKSAAEASVYYACGDVPATPEGAITPSTSDSNTAKQVTINSNGFSPASLTVKKGTKVTFKNSDTKTHWPASAPHPTHTDYLELDPLQAIAAGGTWEFTFTKVGTWKYHDHLNPTQFGTIVVTE
ncbi:MAG: hypothetical protein A3I07_01620 [Candidatus Doudnabacteria bacterium RIFCSPLOWO2_02_FULL_42_9]|uniref:EfeO-type cupredoxin-like domain-containing protein n=1 Tax=Candidatus Doudnabacteria bacterium RIFCSPHIGHO2_01_FULL_41_86 TaxID=1817821 RepID=A0A1F5N7N3_9BACT|nr:MAG: hypothetical protein A2717_02930 [Candidatus Doudnabacteria bacterium RIFCSPHIGHO2_01_FULL_41_86]OGE74650.1 MAG: hypothetical protein A3K07_02525 [Candidatus Doudnabacteria bacterium RIFCSPHIGHO2_01_43_10]OGE85009.1 MAG: hypothetical protein A3E28_04335 [Candidatus Doudnabacteria bacterium RIFCSPHIGHO2_12_FULL_42_22]OGE86450.1 MAG: hypothetical protein A3C49_04515 [Candidatus Doudnabacteria bacterium RIFCSPHIGHO2_02_FULL_42_25]OGE91912.1 MAG: hypothetical protein A2895_01280 [Candidatus